MPVIPTTAHSLAARFVGGGGVALVLLLAGPAAGQPGEPSQPAEGARAAETARPAGETEQLAARLDRLRDEVAAAAERTRALDDTLIDIAGDDAKLRERLDAAGARVAALEQRIAGGEQELAALTERQAAIRNELAARRRELGTVLMALQRMGRRPPPALMVGEGGPVGVVRGAIALNTMLPILDSDAANLTRMLTEASRLAEAERGKWKQLRADLERVGDERARLTALREELDRRRAVSLYEREQATAELARLTERAESVAELIDGLARGDVERVPPSRGFADRRGTLALPVAGRVVSRFGDPTQAGEVAEGDTLVALPESTVFAPMAGTVLFSAPFRSYGRVLILDAGDGYQMVLAGLAEAFVSPGDVVRTGAPLGRMGKSGGRTTFGVGIVAGSDGAESLRDRPALYVELRKDGSAIDSHGWWRSASLQGGRTGG